MNRFMVFAGSKYYAAGGWSDFCASFHTKEEAIAHAQRIGRDWWQVVDSELADAPDTDDGEPAAVVASEGSAYY